MAIVAKVDDRGRVKFPRHVLRPREKVLIIPAGSRIVVIPIPPRPLLSSGGWLKEDVDKKTLRIMVEEEALVEVSRKLEERSKRANRNRYNTSPY